MIVTMGEPAARAERAALQLCGGLPAVAVGGLPDAEAAELLRGVVGAHLCDQVVGRILADTQRNPLALVELGSEFTADQLAGRASLPGPIPVRLRLRQGSLRQVRDLPADTQAFLLLAAADISGERGGLWRAARLAGIDADAAAAAAEAAGLVELSGSSVWFRHPLIRSAGYHGAIDAQRRGGEPGPCPGNDSDTPPRGRPRGGGGRAAAAADVLEQASRALAADDRAARDTLLEATRAAVVAGPVQTRKIMSAARSFPPVSGSQPDVSDLLLEGYRARFTAGYPEAVAPLRAAVAALRADDLDPKTGLRWFGLGVAAAVSLWDDQAVIDISHRWVHCARKLGALAQLPAALALQALSAALAGRFQDVDTFCAEIPHRLPVIV